MELIRIKESLPRKSKWVVELLGIILFIGLWYALVYFKHYRPSVLPMPHRVLSAIPEMWEKYHLARHTGYSILLNLLGYFEAAVVSVIIGFTIGLCPVFRGLSERMLAALRFLPLTPVLGDMAVLLGIGLNMKVQFLALGIAVYLIPVVVQRIDEVESVYIDTVKTHGASKWQAIRTVIIPDVFSRFSDDIRVLVAISWTYIVIAEMINSSDGGIGSMVFVAQKQSRADMVFGLIVIILVVGLIQDRIMKWMDARMYRHKYA
jgi:NitT/TauT family transport system permease protein